MGLYGENWGWRGRGGVDTALERQIFITLKIGRNDEDTKTAPYAYRYTTYYANLCRVTNYFSLENANLCRVTNSVILVLYMRRPRLTSRRSNSRIASRSR